MTRVRLLLFVLLSLLGGPPPAAAQTFSQAGSSGPVMLNGAGAPASGLGKRGDFYLNTTTTCLYGPKTTVWPPGCTSLGAIPGYTTIQSAGTSQTARGIVNFASGVTCTDDATHTRTNCSLSLTSADALLETHTASNSAELDFTSCLSPAHNVYRLVLDGFRPASSGAALTVQFSTDGGATYYGTGCFAGFCGYHWNIWINSATGAGGAHDNGAGNTISGWLMRLMDTTAGDSASGVYQIFNANAASLRKTIGGLYFQDGTSDGGYAVSNDVFVNANITASTVNAFRLLMSAGNIATGTAKCYGLN